METPTSLPGSAQPQMGMGRSRLTTFKVAGALGDHMVLQFAFAFLPQTMSTSDRKRAMNHFLLLRTFGDLDQVVTELSLYWTVDFVEFAGKHDFVKLLDHLTW